MLILGVDVESTGLDVENDRIIEIGWAIWDTERKKPLKMVSELIREDHRIPLTQEIKDITGILPEDIDKFGTTAYRTLTEFVADRTIVGAIVAHNGHNFDYKLIQNEGLRHKIVASDYNAVLVDTMYDLPPKAYGKSSSLTYMAADHGFINPFPHRALTDVLTMLKLVSLYPFQEILDRAKSPRMVVRGCVNFDNKDLAKEQGFRWQEVGDMKFDKCWVKIVKQCDLEVLKSKCKFPVAQLKMIEE